MDRATSRQHRIVIFTSSTCGWCEALKSYLKKHRFRYRELDVSKDPRGAKELERRGIRSVPVVLIDNHPVIGFDREKINRLLDIRRP
jgi:glutaredoxin 3